MTTSDPLEPSTRQLRARRTNKKQDGANGKTNGVNSPKNSDATESRTIKSNGHAVEGANGNGVMLYRMSEQSVRPRSIEDKMALEEEGLLGPRGPSSATRSRAKSHARHPSSSQGEDELNLENGWSRDSSPGHPEADEKSSMRMLSKGKAKDELGRERIEAPALVGKDRHAFALLVALYLLQGIPIGLTFGTLPFLLKPHLSYSQLAIFSLSSWPYSLKLLWSPVVDAWFRPQWGRRKSWIVPVQLILGLGLWLVGTRAQEWLDAEEINIKLITTVFVTFIFFAATQDIAVDGWALTLLSPRNLSYASTAQTIGLHVGYTLSFTGFLTLNSVDFSNRWLRRIPQDYPLVSLGGFFKFWAVVYFIFTLWLALRKKEEPAAADDPDMDVRKVYSVMWSIVRLPNIQSFIAMHLVAKIGFQVHEITNLKLIEKGLPKEDLALTSLLDFPFQMVGGWLAANWSRGKRPLGAWEKAYWARLGMAAVSSLLVWGYPEGQEKISTLYFSAIVATTLLASFTSTIQFVGISAFHTQVADPLIGGTYMTLLNTVSNLGGTWPKPVVLKGIDYFSVAACRIKEESSSSGEIAVRATECVSDHGKAACAAVGGICATERDGYYAMSVICIVLGTLLLLAFVKPTSRRLQSLPLSAWRVKIHK